MNFHYQKIFLFDFILYNLEYSYLKKIASNNNILLFIECTDTDLKDNTKVIILPCRYETKKLNWIVIYLNEDVFKSMLTFPNIWLNFIKLRYWLQTWRHLTWKKMEVLVSNLYTSRKWIPWYWLESWYSYWTWI